MVFGFMILVSILELLFGLVRNFVCGNIFLYDVFEELLLVSVLLEGDFGKVFIGNLLYYVKRVDVKEFFL